LEEGMEKPISGAELTRTTLVESAIRLFGEKGYDAVSTRDIADLAAANIGSIAYHFGGKPGLRRACAEHVINNVRTTLGISFNKPLPKMTPAEALGCMEQTLATFCNFWLVSRESQHFVNFMVRELLDPGEVSEMLYADWMKPMHMRFCAFFGLATGLDPCSEDVKIAVFSFVGQVFHFRVGKPLIMRRLEWDVMGPEETDRLCKRLVMHARALVEAYRRNG
jgi:AcrR family transcriptional regulator